MAIAIPKIPEVKEKGPNASFASPQFATQPQVRQNESVTKGNLGPPKIEAPPTTNATPATPTTPPTPNAAPAQQGKEAESVVVPPAPTPPKPAEQPQPSAPTATTPVTPPGNPAGPTVPAATGAPPGVPATTPPPPVQNAFGPYVPGANSTLSSVTKGNTDTGEYNQSINEYNRKLAEAAYNYNGGPASGISRALDAFTKNVERSNLSRGAAGTYMSSLRGEDVGHATENRGKSDLEAYDAYQKAIREASDFYQKALLGYTRGMADVQKEEAEQAEKKEPTTPIANPSQAGAAASLPGSLTFNPNGTFSYEGPPGMNSQQFLEQRYPGVNPQYSQEALKEKQGVGKIQWSRDPTTRARQEKARAEVFR